MLNINLCVSLQVNLYLVLRLSKSTVNLHLVNFNTDIPDLQCED